MGSISHQALKWRMGNLGVCARIEGCPTPIPWKDVFSSYQVDPKTSLNRDIDLTLRPVEVPVNSESLGCDVSISGDKVDYRSNTFSGSTTVLDDRIVGEFEVATAPPGAIKNVFLASLTCLLSMRGALLLHASSVLRKNRFWLFSGPSASGKTTIATELNGGGRALCYDRTIVSITPDGKIWAQPTPISDIDNQLDVEEGGEIDGIFFIRQSDVCSLEPIPPEALPGYILRNVLAPVRRPAWDDMMLQTIDKLTHSELCRHLNFKKDESFWSLIDSDVFQNLSRS
jgi:hypothetical protein